MYAHRWCLLTPVLIANVKLTACQNGMVLWFLSKGLHYHPHLLYCSVWMCVCVCVCVGQCHCRDWEMHGHGLDVFCLCVCVCLSLFMVVSNTISKLTILY